MRGQVINTTGGSHPKPFESFICQQVQRLPAPQRIVNRMGKGDNGVGRRSHPAGRAVIEGTAPEYYSGKGRRH